MTLSEFKAWFEGFSEGIEAAPTADQFAKIKAKVALIDGAPITYPIFIDTYRRYYYDYWRQPNAPWMGTPVWAQTTAGSTGIGSVSGGHSLPSDLVLEACKQEYDAQFDSHAAMHELGRAEAMN